jgi:Mg-chelatase subunit ChlD
MTIEIRSMKRSKGSSKTAGNLSLVIDCSASMQGEKFKQAKESALSLLGLLGNDDYLSVISFDKSAKLALPSTRKSETAKDTIRKLRIGKGTNIYEGLELAYKEISGEPKQVTSSNRSNNPVTKRIVLLTDGQASVGKTEESDFVDLSRTIRENNITVNTIGIGNGYDQQLLQSIAETGGGLPYHVREASDLQTIFSEQADEVSSTVFTSPTFAVTMMPSAQIRDIYRVTPTLQKLNLDTSSNTNNRYYARLKDIIDGHSQTLALRVDLPKRSAGTYRLARIEVGDSFAKNVEISYTDDPTLYGKETDSYPRMIMGFSEATTLVNKAVQSGDTETILKAETMVTTLCQDQDFETVSTRQPILRRMAATIRRVVERISQGALTESEKREAVHDTTLVSR